MPGGATSTHTITKKWELIYTYTYIFWLWKSYISDVIQSTNTPTHQHRNYGGGSVFRGDSMTWFDGGLVGLGDTMAMTMVMSHADAMAHDHGMLLVGIPRPCP